MQLSRTALKVLLSLAALVMWCAFNPVATSATGTMTINHSNGDSNVYKDVEIKVIHSALYVTSQDGKGTLVINRAACSYQGKILVCFATNATLVQAGETTPLDLKTGTVYINNTDDHQPLVLSSTKVPPHSIVMSLTTKRGTYVTMNGRIDKVVK